MNYRQILAANVVALMERNELMSSHAKLARYCSTSTRKIGARTIGYLVNAESKVNPKIDTIIAVAEAFKVAPWLLLTPDFDPKKKTGGAMPSEKALEIARLIDARNPRENQWEVYRSLFVKGVPDEDLEDLRAPASVQQPTKSREYERAAKRRRSQEKR